MQSSSSNRTKPAKNPLSFSLLVTIIMIIALLLTLPVAASGCRRSSAPQNENDVADRNGDPQQPSRQQPFLADYFPLTVGSTWSYLGEGMEYASFTREVVFARGGRGQLQEDNGGTVIAAVYEITDDAITRIYHSGEAYEVEDLLDRVTPSESESEESEQIVILRTPLQVGTTWQTHRYGTRTITAIDAAVETPAGYFENCIVVKIEGEDSTIHEYFKEGIGLVLREFESEGYRVTSTLEEYEIK